MAVQNFVLRAGEDRTLSLNATDRDGAVFGLTGATLKFYLLDRADGRILEKDGTIVTAGTGAWSVALTDTDTDDLSGGYDWFGEATVSGATSEVGSGSVNVRSRGRRIISDYGRYA